MDSFEITLMVIYLLTCSAWYFLMMSFVKDERESLSSRKSFLFLSKFFPLGPLCFAFSVVFVLVYFIWLSVKQHSEVSNSIKSEVQEEAETSRKRKLDEAVREIEKMKKEDANEWLRQFHDAL